MKTAVKNIFESEGEPNMRKNNPSKPSMIVTNFKTTLLILLVVLFGVQTLNAKGGRRPQGPTAMKADLETSTEAKRVLAGVGSQDLGRIKNPRMRAEALKALGIFKAIAANTSKAREAGLVAQLDRSIQALKHLPQPAGMGLHACEASYARCIELCKEGAGSCKLCNMLLDGCYMNVWAAAIAQEHDPSKH
jgi:hypothetical protein